MDRERLELERLRVQLMAKDQEKQLGADRIQLQSIRDEIRRMLLVKETNLDASSSQGTNLLMKSSTIGDLILVQTTKKNLVEDAFFSEEYERLSRERSELIQSGIYTEDHDLIQSIDKRITCLNQERY